MRSAVLFLCLIAWPVAAHAQWKAGVGLDDPKLVALSLDARSADFLYAASEKRVYRSLDGGATWKRILSASSGDRVRAVLALDANRVFVGTDRGARRSDDGGKRWGAAFPRIGRRPVLCLASDSSGRVWAGTEAGLYVGTPSTDAERVESIPLKPVRAVVASASTFFAATDDSIYSSVDGGKSWNRTFSHGSSESLPEEDGGQAQFQIEEAPRPYISHLACSPAGRCLAATSKGILEAGPDGWHLLKGAALEGSAVRQLAASAATFYAATDDGLFQWNESGASFRRIDAGLRSTRVNALVYRPIDDALVAGSDSGVFVLPHPEIRFPLTPEFVDSPKLADPMALFAQEPSIAEIQAAAVRYAEVHPGKIATWRRQAAWKAWLPTLSVDQDLSRDQNIDIDRGGTGDPDQFIDGPEEESRDWSVSVHWDLGELVWNNDQTSIDTRSRLMVELRDEILTRVTHLYYERRRLQVKAAMAPEADLATKVERRLQLDELTASIDALTEGYLSRRLLAAQPIQREKT